MPTCDHDCDRFKGTPNLSWGVWTIDDDDLEVEANGKGTVSYGSFDQRFRGRTKKWFLVDYATGSDYSGGDLLNKSNFRVLLQLCKDALSEPDTCQEPWFVEVVGGHSTFGIALHCERTPEDIYEKVEGLDSYPILDEDDYSQLQMDEESEAWSDWASHDFKRALEKKFRDIDFDQMSDEDLFELFHNAAEQSNTNWEVEGMGVTIDIDRIVESIEAKDLPGAPGWKMDDDLDGLRRKPSSGKIQVPAWLRRRG